jgi:hypothetical protein
MGDGTAKPVGLSLAKPMRPFFWRGVPELYFKMLNYSSLLNLISPQTA